MCNMHALTATDSSEIARPSAIRAQEAFCRFWEIDHSFRCPIIGMCLTAAEQRHLLKKCGFDLKNKSPYEIHETLVAGAESENRLSRKVDGLLKRKFAHRTADMAALNEEELLRRWHSAFGGGDYGAEFWAVASRAGLSLEARKEIFGMVHMAMHANAEQTAQATRRLAHWQGKAAEQERRIKTLHQDRRSLQKENEALKSLLTETNEALDRMLAEIRRSLSPADGKIPREPVGMETQAGVMALEKENQRLGATVLEQAARLDAKDRDVKRLTARICQISKALDEQKRAEALFRKEAQETLRGFLEMNRCDSECPAFDLCSKRVLIVGGIARMEALYRQLIENRGGVFEYHDGYVNGGARQLENRLKRCDIVLCPVNCNSHAACTLVKNLGKKHNKPVHMLASFSLSAVSRIISACGAGQTSAN